MSRAVLYHRLSAGVAQLYVRRMRLCITMVATGFLLMGCQSTARTILVCPRACKDAVGDVTQLRERLFKEQGEYWLTSASGQPLQSYRYGHGGGVVPIVTSREKPQHISTPILLMKGTKGAVLHLLQAGVETIVSIEDAVVERHSGYSILYIH